MKSLFDSLNLRPNERRILVVVVTAVFLVLNAAFIWPHAGDWRKLKGEVGATRQTLARYVGEIERLPRIQAELTRLEAEGSDVLPAEQALTLQKTVQEQARQFNILITSITPQASATANTNVFFDEQAVTIRVETGEQELVDFLVALGSGKSTIRVREMTLQPSPQPIKLHANITLLASYQKKPKPAAAPATTTAVAAAKPAPRVEPPTKPAPRVETPAKPAPRAETQPKPSIKAPPSTAASGKPASPAAAPAKATPKPATPPTAAGPKKT